MKKEVLLTPEELYFLGRTLQAKYIDYAYIAAMHDINHNFSLFESETKASLVAAGILMEDFSGDVEIDKDVLAVLKPIFFGETETAVDICFIGQQNAISVTKYHFLDSTITCVTGKDQKLSIKATDKVEIQEFLNLLVAEDYSAENKFVETIDKTKITKVFAFKNNFIGKSTSVKTFIEADGIIYGDKDGKIESVTRDQFITDAFNTIKGE